MGRGIHSQIPHLQQSGSSRRGSPAQNRPDAGHHLHHAEGLGHIVVGPHVKAGYYGALVAGGRQKDHRQLPGPGGSAHAEAGAVRQLQVHQSQVKPHPFQGLPGGALPCRRRHGEALLPQKIRQQTDNGVVILRQQYSVHLCSLLIGSSIPGRFASVCDNNVTGLRRPPPAGPGTAELPPAKVYPAF